MPGENEVKKVADLEAQVTDLEAQVGDLAKLLEDASKNNPDLAKALELQTQAMAKVEELTAALEKMATEKAAAEAEAALAKTLADLSPIERDYHKAWFDNLKDKKPDDKKKDEEDVKKWLALPAAERLKVAEKAATAKAASDETVVVSGRTIKKSVVGEDTFAILKVQADEIKKNAETIAKEIEKREDAEFQKRAGDVYPNVPGSVEERAKMLRAIEKMDEPLRKSFETVLTQSEKLAKAGFAKLGHSGGPVTPEAEKLAKGAKDFETEVDKIATTEKCTRTKALAKARQTFPELFKAYQGVEADATAN